MSGAWISCFSKYICLPFNGQSDCLNRKTDKYFNVVINTGYNLYPEVIKDAVRKYTLKPANLFIGNVNPQIHYKTIDLEKRKAL
jgi:hypothetical protein